MTYGSDKTYLINEVFVTGVAAHDESPWRLKQFQQSQRQDRNVRQLPSERKY